LLEVEARVSSVDTGHRRVTDVINTFVASGFYWLKANVSGKSSHKERTPWRIPGDVIFCREDMLLQVEVGGAGKRLAVAFAELNETKLAGSHSMVIRFVGGKRWYYVSPDERHSDLNDALDALKES
jgi:hypothetical protein